MFYSNWLPEVLNMLARSIFNLNSLVVTQSKPCFSFLPSFARFCYSDLRQGMHYGSCKVIEIGITRLELFLQVMQACGFEIEVFRYSPNLSFDGTGNFISNILLY